MILCFPTLNTLYSRIITNGTCVFTRIDQYLLSNLLKMKIYPIQTRSCTSLVSISMKTFYSIRLGPHYGNVSKMRHFGSRVLVFKLKKPRRADKILGIFSHREKY